MKKKYALPTTAIELYKLPKTKTKKEHIRLVIASTGVDVIAKTDNQIYVLSIIKICSYFSFVFSVVLKKVELLKRLKVIQLLSKYLLPWKNCRREENQFFGQSALHLNVFQKRNYQVF